MIWRKGEEMKRSYKCDKERITKLVETNLVEKTDDFTTTLEVQKIITHDNKREKTNHRIFNRELITSRPCNPFMKNNDYVKDLDVQDKFLRPQISREDNTFMFFSESPPQLQKSSPSLLTTQLTKDTSGSSSII